MIHDLLTGRGEEWRALTLGRNLGIAHLFVKLNVAQIHLMVPLYWRFSILNCRALGGYQICALGINVKVIVMKRSR